MTGLEELEAELAGLPASEEDLRAIEEAGFVSAVIDTRFFPSEPGGEHVPGTPHVVSSVYEFESEEGANAAVDVAHTIGLRPCAETCAYEITEFEPTSVPDAKGVEAIATQERIDEIGDDIQPDARYSIYFADGPIAYEVTIFGRPDEVSRQQVEDIAAELYERVEARPCPSPPDLARQPGRTTPARGGLRGCPGQGAFGHLALVGSERRQHFLLLGRGTPGVQRAGPAPRRLHRTRPT